MKISKKNNPFTKDDWSEESLQLTWEIIKDFAIKKYGIEFYKPNFEVVTFEDMLHIYTGSLPILYDHWSFGKTYEQLYKKYMNNHMGVAYECIFNTNPALCYLLETNSPTMQALTISHAAIGHSAFFKNNVLFKEQTNANIIIPFLKHAKTFIKECEELYGATKVEELLDCCHALSMYAFDRSPEVGKTRKAAEAERIKKSIEKDKYYDKTISTLSINDEKSQTSGYSGRLHEENMLKFIGKYSPALKQWQRDIIAIYCKIQQYLYPQMLTKMMNEGFASFWHHTIMSDLADEGLIPEGGAIEFLHSHCSVLRQPDFDEEGYYGINPYKLGYEMFKDIKRICENPTEEDREWFPQLAGTDWVEAIKFAAYNFKDESFILQYLSPKLIRDFKLFTVNDNSEKDFLEISDIHDDAGYKEIRRKLSKSYNVINKIPDMYIEGWDAKRSRTLYINFQEHSGTSLELDSGDTVTDLIKKLWPYPLRFKYLGEGGELLDEGVK